MAEVVRPKVNLAYTKQTQTVDAFGQVTPYTVSMVEDIDVSSDDFYCETPFVVWVTGEGTLDVTMAKGDNNISFEVDAIKNFYPMMVIRVFATSTATGLKAGW